MKMSNRLKKAAALLAGYFLILAGWAPPLRAQKGTAASYVDGDYVVSWYNFGFNGVPGASIVSGNTSTGSQTITICPAQVALPDGRSAFILGGQPSTIPVPITVDPQNSLVTETVTPTAVSLISPPNGVNMNQAFKCANVTATFANVHGASLNSHQVISGDGGLQEAINDAWSGSGSGGAQGGSSSAGGQVVIPPDSAPYVTNAIIQAATVEYGVTILDKRSGLSRPWTATPTGLALAVPTTLTAQAACDATHTFCSDATVAGSASYAGGTLFGCVAYVDIMGNEGPCSLTASFTDVSAKAIDVGVPAASSGAVGYVVYLSLDNGTYAQAYQIPSTSSNCTLTTLETTLPACAVANTTYGQSASVFGKNALFSGGSQITTIALNTGLHFTKLASTVQTTVSLTPMTNSSVTYSYAPSNRVGLCAGISSWNATQEIAAGGISASSTTGIPMSMGTWTIPANCFNFIGAEFRVSGKLVETPSGASDALKVIVAWDAPGTNTTTVPTALCTIANTHTEAAAQQSAYWSCTVKILTTGATGTALVNGSGYFDIATGSAGVLIGSANETAVAASGSINLTAPARISVRFTNTGSTVTNAQPLEGVLEALN
jgi:hypothetical protein